MPNEIRIIGLSHELVKESELPTPPPLVSLLYLYDDNVLSSKDQTHSYPPSSSTSTPASHPRCKFGSMAALNSIDDTVLHNSTPSATLAVRTVVWSESNRFCRRANRCLLQLPLCCCIHDRDDFIGLSNDEEGVIGEEEDALPVEWRDLWSWLSSRNLILLDALIWPNTSWSHIRVVRWRERKERRVGARPFPPKQFRKVPYFLHFVLFPMFIPRAESNKESSFNSTFD